VRKKKPPVEPDTLFSTYIKYIKESGNVIHWIIILLLFIGCEVVFSIYVLNLSLVQGDAATDIDKSIWV
jgi:hypothetical protein